MLRILFIAILFSVTFSFGQADGIVSGSKETVIIVRRGKIVIKKEYTKSGSVLKEYSLAVLGTFVLSSDAVRDKVKIGEAVSKGKLEFILSKDCELVDIRVVTTSQSKIVNEELEVFAAELLDRFKEENHHHIFQFDNELGFVNEDSCVDNITVSVVFKTR